MHTFSVILTIVLIVFYITAIYFAFQAYKEFKGMLYDNGMVGGGGAMAGLMANRRSMNVA